MTATERKDMRIDVIYHIHNPALSPMMDSAWTSKIGVSLGAVTRSYTRKKPVPMARGQPGKTKQK